MAGGRGRGRGRGRGLLKTASSEMTEEVLKLVECKEIPLFPAYKEFPPRKEMDEETKRIVKRRDQFMNGLARLPYHIEKPKPKPAIERYSDRFKKKEVEKPRTLTEVPFDSEFFPEEMRLLWDPQYKRSLREARKRDIENNVNKILEEAKESEKKSSEKTGNNIVFEEDEYEGELEEDDFDEDLEGEYITNFYDDEFDAFEDAAEDDAGWY